MMINKLLLRLPTFTVLLKAIASCFLFLFPLLMQSCVCFPTLLPAAAGNETDRLSLLAFKAQILDDPQNILRSWNESLHFCEWSGVTCGRRHQRVVVLDFHSRQLKGRLTPYIGNLSFLRIIDLENNSFSQEIPQEIGRLFRLRILALSNNTLTGEIPVSISRCSELIGLFLGGNNLAGKLPAELGSLSKLQELAFLRNNLVGEIPSSFGNLSSLELISGTYNNLHGIIPDGLGKLNRLLVCDLAENNLRGIIPPSMYNLSSLAELYLEENHHLRGNLPPNIGLTLPNLESLSIGGNLFSGLVPATIANMTNLLYLSITSNNFTGKVPANLLTPRNLNMLAISKNSLGTDKDDDLEFLYPLVNNTNLEALSININNFGGLLPRTLANFSTKLWGILLGENKIRGSISAEIGNLIDLRILALEGNQLTGSIPDSIGKLQNLGSLTLGGNKISGGLPPSLANLTSLITLGIEKNSLHGIIPASLGNCQSLQYLSFSQNNLSGAIPKQIFSISSLSRLLDLADNQLADSIPSEMRQLVNLGYLDLSGNKLIGEIPGILSSCESLEGLYLMGNNLQGVIPQSLSSLQAIQEIDLSRNNLTGQVPSYLEDLKLLKYLNLSFNNFQGEIPTKGVFKNASRVSVLRNNKLCGGVLELHLPRCSSKRSIKPNNSSKVRLIIGIGFGLLGLILLISFLSIHYLKRKKKAVSSTSFQTTFRQVAYQDLLRATDGFSSTNLIGIGSFGTVYKGILDLDGMVVAVKVFNPLGNVASRSFIAECKALTNIRHRNLVKVVTVCSSIDFQGNDFKALVYEFMANGSLEEWLHSAQGSYDNSDRPKKLNLIQRLNIAIDVASAVEYLHHHCGIPIVHCDLKPSNALLNSDLIAHVGDFGLARILRDSTIQSTSNNSSSIGIKGTIGYVAPEYGMGSSVSTSGDVYSYGIMLLEMFTGKRPTDAIFKDGLNLHTFVESAFHHQGLEEVVDPIFLGEELQTSVGPSTRVNRVNKDAVLECIASILEVGVACSAEFSEDRMDIRDVGTQLQRIKRTHLGKGRHGHA